MNKKSFLIFLLGVFSAGAVFGAVMMVSKPHSPAVVPPATDKFESPTAPVSTVPSAETTLLPAASAGAAAPLPPSAAVESEAFKSLMSKAIDAHSSVHTVAKGDNLTRLSKKYGVPGELIQRINGLPDDKLRIGQKLKVPVYKFSAVVDKSQNTLILKGDEEVLKTYVVSTGSNNSTPVGTFTITDRLVNPTWYKTGAVVPYGSAENVLGTRWMGITQKGYGIHGTVEPEKLGTQCTAGCVRMRNDEVEELYAFLSTGSEVTVVD